MAWSKGGLNRLNSTMTWHLFKDRYLIQCVVCQPQIDMASVPIQCIVSQPAHMTSVIALCSSLWTRATGSRARLGVAPVNSSFHISHLCWAFSSPQLSEFGWSIILTLTCISGVCSSLCLNYSSEIVKIVENVTFYIFTESWGRFTGVLSIQSVCCNMDNPHAKWQGWLGHQAGSGKVMKITSVQLYLSMWSSTWKYS